MLDRSDVNALLRVKPGGTPWVDEGLRDFFLNCDRGVATPTPWSKIA